MAVERTCFRPRASLAECSEAFSQGISSAVTSPSNPRDF